MTPDKVTTKLDNIGGITIAGSSTNAATPAFIGTALDASDTTVDAFGSLTVAGSYELARTGNLLR